MPRDTAQTCAARTAPVAIRPPRGARALLTRLLDLQALWRQRRRLAELDDAALRDMGLTRSEALHEARRPVWDAPAHWRN
ncbi:MAG: DUF1127 domain-containing protein [Rhodobacteraceae bacterium]|uniref:DUF1127 domain-containing protein n=1 Tax=Salipiger thiooxidans TaxID=282683 RepID=UPI001A8DCB65|nr:DUF1127 domain-containing protein [Salipiger thiooxidans]MBN8187315.1 DUF1127 domain-containing protein [Salipiger thiooxidans]MBR9837879.1 DUF1127 domain-containing protein [Paracoccaceae bacterium]